jgi:glycosyltransferase involved in cell wall biosynthesis
MRPGSRRYFPPGPVQSRADSSLHDAFVCVRHGGRFFPTEATGRSLPGFCFLMTRILHVLTSPRAEGTPRLVLDWLSVDRCEQGVAFLSDEPADLIGDFRRTGCWLRAGRTLVPGPRKFFEIARAAHGWVREFRPDVVIAWPTGFSHWIFLGARAAGSRAALLSHGGNPPATNWFGRYVATWICLWITAACDGRLVACSRYVQRQFCKIPLVPGSIVGFAYNSLRAEAIARRAEAARATRGANEPFRAIMVATLESHKDHATLIRAARLLEDRGVELEILLVGAGGLEQELKTLATALGVNGTVKFLGARRDVPELLGQSDLFVFSTTTQEGRPGVILEALAASLPIVATDVEPLREVLENGRWGKLVPPADPAALAEVLSESARTRISGAELRETRRAFATAFTPERMLGDYLREAALEPAVSG